MRAMRLIAVGLIVVLVLLVGVAFGLREPAESVARHDVSRDKPRVIEKWRVELPGDVVGLPAADQAGVVVTVGASQVVAVSPTGEIEWSAAVDGALANAPRLDDDLAFVAAERAVVALRRVDGVEVWSVPTASGNQANRANRPVVVGDVVVATAADGLVLGLERATGAERWRVSLPTATTAEPAASAAGAPSVVVIVGIAEWRALDPATGATLWTGDIGLFGTSSPVVYPGGADVLAAVATNEQVIAVNARTGTLVWKAPAEQSELYQVPLVAANGTELLVPDHWGRLTSFDPYDGRRLWSVTGPDTMAEFGEPVLIDDQLVALPLDGHGPRLGSPHGSTRLRPPADGHGVADLPRRGLVVTTWGGTTNYVLLYEVR